MQNTDDRIPLYQYLFQSEPFGDSSPQQIRFTAVAKIPTNVSEYEEWKTNALGATIAMFSEGFHLDLSKQRSTLEKPPEMLHLGDTIYTAASLLFDNMQTYFLVTINKNFTYTIVLISIDKDPKARETRIQALIDSVRSVEYL